MNRSCAYSKKKDSPSLVEEARKLLVERWEKINSWQEIEVPSAIKQKIDYFFSSVSQRGVGIKGFRYALITQIIAKISRPELDIFSIQVKDEFVTEGKKSFDARSFCKKVIIWFEKKYLQDLLGGSSDPYVSKPLRKPILFLENGSVKNKEAFEMLIEILDYTEKKY
jgi:hypothetical protein